MTHSAHADSKNNQVHHNTVSSHSEDAYSNSGILVYDFNIESNLDDWQIINDSVMGGVSHGGYKLDEHGNGVFTGRVSLANNGGFTSMRHRFDGVSFDESITKIVIRVKGDGKRYQLRIREKVRSMAAYIAYFNTTGEWQTIEIPLNSMYPSFHGRDLPFSNFKKNKFKEIAFLIANERAEEFQLIIDSVHLE